MKLFPWRRTRLAPNAWRHDNHLSVDIRHLPASRIENLTKGFGELKFVDAGEVMSDRTRLRLTLADSFVKREWYEQLGDVYLAKTGRRLVFEATVAAPKMERVSVKPGYSTSSSRGSSDGFWFWAWLVAVFWPSSKDNG